MNKIYILYSYLVVSYLYVAVDLRHLNAGIAEEYIAKTCVWLFSPVVMIGYVLKWFGQYILS